MKIKRIERTANVAWSPQSLYPVYLAAGAVDQPFSTSAALEIYELNLNDPGNDMTIVASSKSENRFHKLKWGTYGQSTGTIVGGCDGGVIEIYNASKLLKGEKGLISEERKHKGPVKALDFNSFQSNLMASGSSESEIYIWDLNNPTKPMTPGSKSQSLEDVTSVTWNKQVQHILASSFPSKCVVWDLRKNDPIIKLSDSTIKIRWSVVAWNPDIATQLCLGSEADQSPIIQLWDLRFATSPLKILENHQQGVLSLSWCQQDTDMLLSCGRDSKILCWNPNSSLPNAEIICEIISSDQWNFDVAWCPRNPALFACSSLDGHVNIYSLVGGPQQVQTSNKIADSFPGMELYTQAPVPQSHSIPIELRRAPKWLKRPVRASFGFGGKLATIENVPASNELPPSRRVYISQVVTEPGMVTRSMELEAALKEGQYYEYCQTRIAQLTDVNEKNVWQFLSANFDSSPRNQFLNLLGYQREEINNRLAKAIGKNLNVNEEIRQVSDRITALGRSTDSDSELEACDDVSNHRSLLMSSDGIDLKNSSDFDLSITSTSNVPKDFKISAGDDPDGLICQALLLGNTEAAVELCLQNNRMADAIILAMTGGSELLAKTQFRHFQQNTSYLSMLISALVTEDWSQVIRNCDIESWKEALVAAISYANEKEFPILCEILGERLENEKNGILSKNAQLCYICAGNLGKLVSSRLKSNFSSSPENLQGLVELVMLLKKAMEFHGVQVDISGRLADVLSKYAAVLASQGSLEAAMSYLGNSNDPQIAELRERLNFSVGRTPTQSVQSQPRQSSLGQLPSQRTRTLSAGFYPHQKKQEDTVTNPSQIGFNLNPIQAPVNHINTAPTQSYPLMPFPSPSPSPLTQSVPPTLLGAYPSPSPVRATGVASRTKHVLDLSVQSSIPRPMSNSSVYPQNQFSNPPYPQSIQSNNFNLNHPGYPIDAFNAGTNSVPQMPPSVPRSQTPANVQPPGWNDPPMLDASRNMPKEEFRNMSAEHAGTRKWKSVITHAHSQQPKQEFVPQAPITHPLMGSIVPDSAVNGQSGDYNSQHQEMSYQFQSYPGQQQPMPPPQQQHHFQQYQPGNLPNQMMSNYQNQELSSAPKPPLPGKQMRPEPVKKAIPEEHVILQTVFDELRNKCIKIANNPQSRKKLDDVAKKLDALYDNLREGRLSSNTLQGLHLMVQHIQARNYPNGLMLHTQLVSGPDFAQIASFMPGIKVLLQSALQLEVYL